MTLNDLKLRLRALLRPNRVEQELESLGMVTGSIESDRLDELGRVEGISYAEPSRPIQIAPPEREIQ